jgi:hypothetical protein
MIQATNKSAAYHARGQPNVPIRSLVGAELTYLCQEYIRPIFWNLFLEIKLSKLHDQR